MDKWLKVSASRQVLQGMWKRGNAFTHDEYEAIFEDLSGAHTHFNRDALDLLERRRSESITRLHRLIGTDAVSMAGIKAALVICEMTELEDQKTLAYLLLALRRGTDEEKMSVLDGLGTFALFGDTDSRTNAKKILNQPEMASELLRQLDSKNGRVLEAAIDACAWIRPSGCWRRLWKWIKGHDRSHPHYSHAVYRLAEGEFSAACLDLALKLPKKNGQDNDIGYVQLLSEAVQRGDEKSKVLALKELRRIYSQWPPDGWSFISTRTEVLKAISAACAKKDVVWLRKALDTERGPYAEPLVRALAQFDVKSAVEWLSQRLSEDKWRTGTIHIISELFRGTADLQITKIVVQSFARTEDKDSLAAICWCLLAIGGPNAKDEVRLQLNRLNRSARATVEANVDAPTLEFLAQRIVDAGVLSKVEAKEALKELDGTDKYVENLRAPGWLRLLQAADVAFSIYPESNTRPPRHDLALERFKTASRGKFRPEAVVQEPRKGKKDEMISLSFIHGKRVYTAQLRDYGKWFDMERLGDTVNRVLKDHRVIERFIPIDPPRSDDATATYVFIKPKDVTGLANALQLPSLGSHKNGE